MYIDTSAVYGLWYFPKINRFTDEDSNILHDLQDLFDIWQLDEWKKTKNYGSMVDKYGNLCELYYLDEDKLEEICNHDCEVCKCKCPAYSMWRHWKTEYFERSYI